MEIKTIRLNNLKTLVLEKGTIAAVARASGVSEAYLSQLLNRTPLPSGAPRGVGNALARKLEKGCEKPLGWMDQQHSSIVETEKEKYGFRPIKVWDEGDPLDDDEVEVPMLDLKLSAGSGRLQWEINPKGFNRFRKGWCMSHGYHPEKLTTVMVDGESMSDVLPDRSSVTINTDDRSIRNGKIYAIDFRGQFMIKRLFVIPGGGVRIVSENSDKDTFPDIIIYPEHEDDLIILGRAVCFSADL